MASSLRPLHLLLCLLVCVGPSVQTPQHYVVYMGSPSNGRGGNAAGEEAAHLHLLSSLIPSQESERISLLHLYSHAFKGFSAMLTEKEASILSGHDEVVSVFRDPTLKLHTTHSWDFLEAESRIRSSLRDQHLSSDVIIGVIDTGIWPESPSFKDDGVGEIPSRWKGVCMEGPDFKKSRCNRKIIGARYYNPSPGFGSPRDAVGHGTHTASIAAGAVVPNASYYGLANGTARGGSPSARIASYKACSEFGCSGAVLLRAIDDAIKDGVDIISISIGLSSELEMGIMNDVIAIGAFHAEQMGVMVVCSAGNDGPDPYTLSNSAPWLLTVSASTIDRDFRSNILLGNREVLPGIGINFSNLTASKTYPLVLAEQAAYDFSPLREARNCYPGSLDPKKVAGKIIVCTNTDPNTSRNIKKLYMADAKAKGLILIDEEEKNTPYDSGIFPFSEVGNHTGSRILKYINSTKNPIAAILGTKIVLKFRPAPVVAYFSSRGPGRLTENILKPDVMAPGVAILAAMMPKKEEFIGKKPSPFAFRSGTSMACPHVSGAAGFIKSLHRSWSSSMVKSALMTTATAANNIGKPLTNSWNSTANPHEMGAGEINPLKSLDPGLVFETTTIDYLNFLCYYGIPEKKIRLIFSERKTFSCPRNSNEDLISNINYPSISIAKLSQSKGMKTVKRTVTNMGNPNAFYVSSIDAPPGLEVEVSPKEIGFSKASRKASFSISFGSKDSSKGYKFGAVTWSDGHHIVRTVFAVNVE
ncbi:CO(2)-response secreted protease-like isoform X1 [Diospyros lotus]|uniref:CO(2)-response secreted protease-like isoform X1 n=1 Tax=Diospyros lotus TaxID=55363 RepID=UPI00225C17FC|nr:CO(2)-response secreted protease-like isoform X1 [Diospyros lotus]